MIQETRIQSLLPGIPAPESRQSENTGRQDAGTFLQLLRGTINGVNTADIDIIQNQQTLAIEPAPQGQPLLSETRHQEAMTQPRSDMETTVNDSPATDEIPREESDAQNNALPTPVQENHTQGEAQTRESQGNSGEARHRENRTEAEGNRQAQAEQPLNQAQIPAMMMHPLREIPLPKETLPEQAPNGGQTQKGSPESLARLRDLSVQLATMTNDTNELETNNTAERRMNRVRLEQDPKEALTKNEIATLRTLIDQHMAEHETGEPSGRTLSQIQTLLQRITVEGEKAPQQTMQGNSEFRDLSARIAAVMESLQGDAGAGKNNDGGGSHQNSFQFAMGKNEGTHRTADLPQTAQPQQRLFQEQLQQLVDQARITVRDAGSATISMRLQPEELGNIRCNIGLEQGVITGRFTVESENARNLLLQNLDSIRTELENAGITVGDFQVNVSGRQEEFADEGNHPSHRISQDMQALNAAVYDTGTLLLHDGAFNVVI